MLFCNLNSLVGAIAQDSLTTEIVDQMDTLKQRFGFNNFLYYHSECKLGMPDEKVDLVAAILNFSIQGASKQALQTEVKISSSMLDRYVKMLLSKDLISILADKSGKNQSIKITERGEKFLQLYDSIRTRYLTTKA